MKSEIFLFAASLSAALALSSCIFRVNTNGLSDRAKKHIASKGVIVDTSLNPAAFNSITVNGPLKVNYSQGETKVEITGPDDLICYLNVESKDGNLSVSIQEGIIFDTSSIIIKIYSEHLNSATLRGSGTLSVHNVDTKTSENKSLSLILDGSGEIKGSSLKAETCDIKLAGSGDIEIENIVAGSLKTSLSGSGDIDISFLEAGSVEAGIAGSGDTSLSGRADSAVYSIVGSGDIDAKALDSKSVQCKVTGSGDIKYMLDGKILKHSK